MRKVLYVLMATLMVMSFIGCSVVQNAKSVAVDMGLSNYKFDDVGKGSMRESMVAHDVRFLPVDENKTLVPAYISVLTQSRYTKYAEFFDQRCTAEGGDMTITGPIKETSTGLDGTSVTETQQTFAYNADNKYVRKILDIEKVGYTKKNPAKPFEVTFKCTDNQGTVFSALMHGGIAYGGFRELSSEYQRYIPIMVTTKEKQPDIMYPYPINEQLDNIHSIDEFFKEKFVRIKIMSGNSKYLLKEKPQDGIYKIKNRFYSVFGDPDNGRVGYANVPNILDVLYDLYYVTKVNSETAVFKTPYGDIKDMLLSYLWVKGGRWYRDDIDGYYGITGDPAWETTFKLHHIKDTKYTLITFKKGYDESRLANQQIRPLNYTTADELKPYQKYDAENVSNEGSSPTSKSASDGMSNTQPIPNSVTSLNKEIAKNAASDEYVEKINGTLLYQGIKTGEKDGCDTVGIIKIDGDDVRSKKNFKVCGDKVFPLEETTTEEVDKSLRMLAARVVMNCNTHGQASLSKGSYTVKCKQPNLNKGVFEIFYLRENLLIGYETVNIEQAG